MDKKKRFHLADHPANSVPNPTQPFNGSTMPVSSPVLASPGQELDPSLQSV